MHLTGTASSSGAEAFASINTFTSTDALRSQERINRENVEGYRLLTHEPAIARVAVCDEDGKKLVYYICRTAPVPVGGNDIRLASYRSQVGRLAALSLGDEFIRAGRYDRKDRWKADDRKRSKNQIMNAPRAVDAHRADANGRRRYRAAPLRVGLSER